MDNGIKSASQTLQEQSLVISKHQFSEIELTPDETAEALRLMRKEKYHIQKQKEWRESMTKTYEPIKMDARRFRQYIIASFPELNPDLQKTQFDQLVNYFTGEEEKGLLMFGGVGVGKTKLMECFEWNPKGSYAVKSCREISEQFARGGFEAMQIFKGLMRGQRNDFNQVEYGICFDDLGEEKSKKHFGNESNVMEDILLARYQRKELWKFTHITTNLTVEQIEEIYGARVRSRMREMFIAVDFSAITDLRGKHSQPPNL